MIHKLFFIGGLFLLILAAVMHHGYQPIFMHGIHHMRNPKRMSDFMIRRLSWKLKLNEDQKAKFIEVRDDLLARHDQLQTEHESLYLTMFEEIGKDTLDQKRLNSEIEKKIIKMQAAVPQVVSRLAELHATLTTEQKKMLVQMIRKNHKTSQR